MYVAANFAFGGRLLKALQSAASGDLLELVTTSITRGEVEANITQRVTEAMGAIKHLRKEHYVLRNFSEFEGVFADTKGEALSDRHKAAFAEFLKVANVTDVDVDLAKPSSVFSDYFDRKAPFGSEKSKAEFPDAFVVAALQAWCEAENEEMYVVSGDEPMRQASAAATRLHPLDSLDALFRIINAGHQGKFVQQAIKTHRSRVIDRLKPELDPSRFFVGGTDGEVNDVEIGDIHLKEDSITAIEVSETKAVVRLVAEISYRADITFDDPSTGFYDSEDGVMMFVESKNDSVTAEEEVPVEVEIAHLKNAPFDFSVESMTVNEGQDFEVTPDWG
jgi:hypothetical protein